MNRNVFSPLLVSCLIAVMWTPAAHGQAGKSGDEIVKNLGTMLDTKDFRQRMSMREFLFLLHDKTEGQGKEVAFKVALRAFREELPDLDPWSLELQMDRLPGRASLANLLKAALDQVKEVEATFLIRDDMVEITTKRFAAKEVLYNQPVLAVFNQVPLSDALGELTDASGVSINIDPQAKDKARTPVTARFRNDVALQDAVRMLAEMAEMKVVYLPTGLYVTTAAQALRMQKELNEQYDVQPGQPGTPLSPPLPPPARGIGAA